MIRKLSLFLILCLLAGGMPARSEAAPGPLTSAEFAAFEAWIREAAKTDGFYTAAPTEDGYALRFKDFVLYADRPELTEETVLTAAVLDAPPEEDGTYPDLRGIAAGAPLWDVLSRYPLDNPSLSGTREEAGLCLSGSVPGSAFTGLLHRDGQTALSAVYSLYEVAPGGVRVYSAAYAFSQGAVSMIRVSFAPALLSVQAAQKAFGNCADLMAVREYSAYLPSSGRPAEPFHEEDLLFSGLDFLNLSPDGAKAVLGDPATPEIQGFVDKDGNIVRSKAEEEIAAKDCVGVCSHMVQEKDKIPDQDTDNDAKQRRNDRLDAVICQKFFFLFHALTSLSEAFPPCRPASPTEFLFAPDM